MTLLIWDFSRLPPTYNTHEHYYRPEVVYFCCLLCFFSKTNIICMTCSTSLENHPTCFLYVRSSLAPGPPDQIEGWPVASLLGPPPCKAREPQVLAQPKLVRVKKYLRNLISSPSTPPHPANFLLLSLLHIPHVLLKSCLPSQTDITVQCPAPPDPTQAAGFPEGGQACTHPLACLPTVPKPCLQSGIGERLPGEPEALLRDDGPPGDL